MVGNENSCKLKLNEYDETFSEDVAENTKVPVCLYSRNSVSGIKINPSADD